MRPIELGVTGSRGAAVAVAATTGVAAVAGHAPWPITFVLGIGCLLLCGLDLYLSDKARKRTHEMYMQALNKVAPQHVPDMLRSIAGSGPAQPDGDTPGAGASA